MPKMKKPTAAYKRLEAEYRKLAKRADQRLVRLEKLEGSRGFKGVTRFAYQRAMRDIKAWSGESARRFNTSPPDNTQALKAKIADIKNFLQMETSTKKGIVEGYKRRAESFNKTMGTDLDWKQMEQLFSRGIAEKLDRYGYGAYRAIAIIQKAPDQVKRDIRRGKNIDLNVDDNVLEERIREMIKKNKKELKQLGII